jgi:hypothetical protein
MPRRVTEIERARELYEKAQISIAVYERLKNNGDFQVFLENTITKPVEQLLDLLETVSTEDLPLIREQIKVLRSIGKHFDATLARKSEVDSTLKELQTEEKE